MHGTWIDFKQRLHYNKPYIQTRIFLIAAIPPFSNITSLRSYDFAMAPKVKKKKKTKGGVSDTVCKEEAQEKQLLPMLLFWLSLRLELMFLKHFLVERIRKKFACAEEVQTSEVS